MPSEQLLLIRQYRPPTGTSVIEFPAGLIDDGESPQVAALRELHEETGYRGTILRMIPPTFNSPGLTGEAVHQVRIDVDETLPENIHPVADPDEGEFIQPLLVPVAEIATFIDKHCAAGTRLDSKVMTYLLGMITQSVKGD
jgi:8-oxo-dGTP pyrophosphatase MutT (NUDIX family)